MFSSFETFVMAIVVKVSYWITLRLWECLENKQTIFCATQSVMTVIISIFLPLVEGKVGKTASYFVVLSSIEIEDTEVEFSRF